MKNGDLIVIPTDTVYGLAAKLHDLEALDKIYELKGRDQSKQIPILIANKTNLVHMVKMNAIAVELTRNLWPGPITFVFKTKPKFFALTGEKTVAIRMPNHPKAREIIEKYGPLRVTSLNQSGQPPLTDLDEIKRLFGPYVAEIFEQDRDPSNLSSTVVDLTTPELKILRRGIVTEEDIEDALIQYRALFKQE
jgi:L-threonylcarbamoyladenylate synthase